MRLLIGAAIIICVAGCNPTADPDASRINVRVLDDAEGPINRTRIIFTMGADRFEELTNSRGLASVAVENDGEYTVRVLPRAGYAGGSGPIQKSVTVSSGTAEVAFHLVRDGVTQGNNPPPGEYPTQTWW